MVVFITEYKIHTFILEKIFLKVFFLCSYPVREVRRQYVPLPCSYLSIKFSCDGRQCQHNSPHPAFSLHRTPLCSLRSGKPCHCKQEDYSANIWFNLFSSSISACRSYLQICDCFLLQLPVVALPDLYLCFEVAHILLYSFVWLLIKDFVFLQAFVSLSLPDFSFFINNRHNVLVYIGRRFIRERALLYRCKCMTSADVSFAPTGAVAETSPSQSPVSVPAGNVRWTFREYFTLLTCRGSKGGAPLASLGTAQRGCPVQSGLPLCEILACHLPTSLKSILQLSNISPPHYQP